MHILGFEQLEAGSLDLDNLGGHRLVVSWLDMLVEDQGLLQDHANHLVVGVCSGHLVVLKSWLVALVVVSLANQQERWVGANLQVEDRAIQVEGQLAPANRQVACRPIHLGQLRLRFSFPSSDLVYDHGFDCAWGFGQSSLFYGVVDSDFAFGFDSYCGPCATALLPLSLCFCRCGQCFAKLLLVHS